NSEETRRWLTLQARQSDIRIVFNQRNSGIANATNAGLAEAKGDWITFLDHDDVIAPEALNMIARTLSEHPETMFLYTDEVVVDDKLKPTGVM
ncbi:glycosyltransferase, partial [Achromobacter sp. SIMBA_011]|uniref:glycosyltransferase n=1 Tax=Achromobacter sp. SIMBA_011 TaxID=3085759 RepID=UPI00397C886D